MSESPPTSSPPPARKPLSMLWVLAAIGCFVVVHTVINVAYRKPERPHEPVAEARERQRLFVKAELNGWTHYGAVLAATTASPREDRAEIVRSPAPENILEAVSFDLAGRPGRNPILHVGPALLEAPLVLPGDGVLRLILRFDAPEKTNAFGLPLAFSKNNHLYLFLQDESRKAPEEPPLAPAPALELTLPSRALVAGAWNATLYTKDTIYTWSFSVPENLAAQPAPTVAQP